MSLGTGDITRIIRASREALGLDRFGRKKCKHMREDGICLNGASSSGKCMLACSHYCTETIKGGVTKMKYPKCNVCPHICECCANHGGSHACGDCYTNTHHEFKPKAHICFCPIDGAKIICEDEKNKPLIIEDLIKMQDKAVWVQLKGDPLNGHWGVVEGASVSYGSKYLYLWGDPLPYLIDEYYEAFITRQIKGA